MEPEVTNNDIVHYTAKVQDTRLLELPEEATELGLRPGDEVEVSVLTVPHHNGTQQRTSQERAKAYRIWAESHSGNTLFYRMKPLSSRKHGGFNWEGWTEIVCP